MRILLVSNFYPAHGGGVERVAAELAKRMAPLCSQIIWCASDIDAPPQLEGVRCVPMSGWHGIERISSLPFPVWDLRSLRQLVRLCSEVDAVHVHDCIYLGSLLAAWASRSLGHPLVVTQHIGAKPLPRILRAVLDLGYRLGVRTVLKPARGVAFISAAGLRYFEHMSGPQAHWRHVPNGVDTTCFKPEGGTPAQLRAELGLDATRPLMLFVGRFVPTKRLPLLREMARLRPEWQWCIVGHGPEQPTDWGLPQVRVMPPMAQPQLAKLYRAADLLVLPSHGEGFPLVVQEAMACGLMVAITAEVAAGSALPAELWVRLPDQPAGFAQAGVAALQAALELPPSMVEARRAACVALATKTWNWETAARAHLGWIVDASP
jgi:glycosyltransferase involved in cell wall biosynthesis